MKPVDENGAPTDIHGGAVSSCDWLADHRQHTLTYADIMAKNEGFESLVIGEAELVTDDTGATVGEVRLLDTEAVPPDR